MPTSTEIMYKPRHPKGTKFYSILEENYEAFLDTHDKRFRERYGYLRAVVSEAICKYLDCLSRATAGQTRPPPF